MLSQKSFSGCIIQEWVPSTHDISPSEPSPQSPSNGVKTHLQSLAGQLYVEQCPFVDEIIKLAMEGGKDVQEKIKRDVLPKIKDDAQRQSMANSIETYGDPKQTLLSEVENALKDTASQDRYTNVELWKAANRWLTPGVKLARQNKQLQSTRGDRGAVVLLTSAMTSLRLEDDCSSISTRNGRADDINVSAFDATTSAARTSGFIHGEDECSPSEMADLYMEERSKTSKGDLGPDVEEILTSIRIGFVDHYLDKIRSKALETVTSQIDRTARGCLADLERLAKERRAFFEERHQQRNGTNAESRREQTLKSMVAWGNLVAAMKAMEVLQHEWEAIEKDL